jgi:hypothetical protein
MLSFFSILLYLNSKFSRYSAAARGQITSAVKRISGWLNNRRSVAAAAQTSTITVLPLVTAYKDDLRRVRQELSLQLVGDRDLRCGNFLCPVRCHIIAVPLPLLYKS